MDRLKAYLAQHGIKQTEFAARANIAPSYLNDILNGRRSPSLAVAGRIASASKGRVPLSTWIEAPKGATA